MCIVIVGLALGVFYYSLVMNRSLLGVNDGGMKVVGMVPFSNAMMMNRSDVECRLFEDISLRSI